MESSSGEASFLDRHRPKVAVALLFTFASAVVDIVGFLGVYHLFTAHLTGTTVQIGRGLASGDWFDVLAAIIVVVSFVFGSIVGRTVIEFGARKSIRRIATVNLAIESTLLIVAALESRSFTISANYNLAILAAAMGLQTATLTGIGPLTVHTTFVTGMLNKLAQVLSHIGFRGYDLLRSKNPDASKLIQQKREIEIAVFLSALWFLYLGGAAIGAWVFQSWGLRTLFLPVGSLSLGLAADQLWPLSIHEEKEQSER